MNLSLLKNISELLSREKGLIAILLFGSQAKGTLHAESDVKFLIISIGKIKVMMRMHRASFEQIFMLHHVFY